MAIDPTELYGLRGNQVIDLADRIKANEVAFKPFPDSVVTDGTTEQFMNSVLALGEPVGTAFLGTVSLSDLPAGLVQEEVMVYVYSDYVVYCEVKSTDVAPYIWWCASYNYQGWRPVNTDTTYSAGTGLELTGTTFSVDNTIATKSEIPSVFQTVFYMNASETGVTRHIYKKADMTNPATSKDVFDANDKGQVILRISTSATPEMYSDAYLQNAYSTTGDYQLLFLDEKTYRSFDTSNLNDDTFVYSARVIQDKLTAGTNVQINGATISATDTTYSDFVGATSGDAGTHGLVPAPASGDTDKYLKSDGSWATVSQYSLPAATANTLGGVKIGSNLSMDANDVLSATDTTYTAGTNISISSGNVISATDTTYSNFVGTDGAAAGTAGLVPAPATTDAGKYLKADGTWGTVSAGPTVVQTTGTSTTDVMSQNAVTGMIYPNATNRYEIKLGNGAKEPGNSAIFIGRNAGTDYSISAVSIGTDSRAGNSAVAVGDNAQAAYGGSVALGAYSKTTATGQIDIGSTNTTYGYNSSNYRLLTGLYDPQTAHDAATKGYADTKATITMTTTDPGEGSPLAANSFIAVYSAS